MIRYWLILLIVFAVPALSWAGTSFMDLSKSMTIITLARAEKVLLDAKENSQKAMSKEEVAKIKAKADAVLDNAGSMVFCSSLIIKEGGD